MKVYVGTSGWVYDWNPDGLDWYVKNSGLNAVELNASFYRFPFKNMVLSWSKKGRDLRWSVKVNRSITHAHKLNERCYPIMEKFLRLFEPMDDLIDFYLLQLPPSFVRNEKNVQRLLKFVERFSVPLAVEFRHESWIDEETVNLAQDFFIVSFDSPMGTWIVKTHDVVYLRMHGRTAWYAHNYSEEELAEVANKIKGLRPKKVYVFFNNDHWMLENARLMLKLLKN